MLRGTFLPRLGGRLIMYGDGQDGAVPAPHATPPVPPGPAPGTLHLTRIETYVLLEAVRAPKGVLELEHTARLGRGFEKGCVRRRWRLKGREPVADGIGRGCLCTAFERAAEAGHEHRAPQECDAAHEAVSSLKKRG